MRNYRETDPATYEDTTARLRERAPSSTAGGLPAVVSAMGHVDRALGVDNAAILRQSIQDEIGGGYITIGPTNAEMMRLHHQERIAVPSVET